MACTRVPLRFHPNHSNNVSLEENRSVAYRTAGFGGSIVLSERYLFPGEFFVVEIEQNENHWLQGYLRLGLTKVNPTKYSPNDPVHIEEMFDHIHLGSTWMFRVTDLLLSFSDCKELDWPFFTDVNKVDICENYIRTCCGSYARVPLSFADDKSDRHSKLKVGYKVGVVYIPDDENSAGLYYVVNGNIFGPYAKDIPYKESPLFAVADLFGKTKKIRVLPLRFERTLKQLCRMIILETYDMQKVNKLHLPKSIIDYLNFNSVTTII